MSEELNEAKAFAERYNLLIKSFDKYRGEYETIEDYLKRINREYNNREERIKKLHLEINDLEKQIDDSNSAELSRLYYSLINLDKKLKSNKYKNLKKDLNLAAEIIFKYVPKSYLNSENR